MNKTSLHPNFILGAVSFILFLLGVVIKGSGYVAGNIIVLTAISIGAIHWIWGIKDVFSNSHLNSRSKSFWLIPVLLIPPLGGMIYYLMKHKNVRI